MEIISPFFIQRSGERAHADHGWLNTYHSFSFADYIDPTNLHWGALRVFNDDVIAAGTGFGMHPHRDMEILTYVLDGELEHRDSMGNVGIVRPGGVQYLSAGTGIRHSEYNHSQKAPCRFVQMWIMPRAQSLAPRYGQVDFEQTDREHGWLAIASGRSSVIAPIPLWQDAACFVMHMNITETTCMVDTGRFGFLFVAKGTIVARDTGDFTTELRAGDAVRIAGAGALNLRGSGELVFWDVPPFTVT